MNDSTVRKRNEPGTMKYAGSTVYQVTESAIIWPHDGVGGSTPTPRNDRLASVPM